MTVIDLVAHSVGFYPDAFSSYFGRPRKNRAGLKVSVKQFIPGDLTILIQSARIHKLTLSNFLL